jgi:hypothetical protein
LTQHPANGIEITDGGSRIHPVLRRGLQQLLHEIGSGAITDAGDLDELDLQLLRAHYGHDEEIETLLDRLRGQDREEG